ncbi:LysR family transcriptional regulator [Pseudomonas argentinensis]|uniref:Transcriptional regulator, LysR family n=1 Tax=Phytopseudomonas argentinensis TaxID=289370 RepID=A0A1I3HLW4_9GAMM|nr:LysR family transcriptional regulator [Pseudomonas argentinensis]KAB0548294.1 LysR family transcriptional regulator [Pseudomonas argentinensis]SFI36736.1 transcriptional regulator, LysR family [Pseudomonas argentinensis]
MNAVLDIELIRTFHAVARSGRFKAAAEQLHKSPAAISVHIQRLETVAGGRLFDRDNQSVALTVLGKRLLRSTSELLSTHDRVLAELQGPRLVGRIRLGIPDEYAAHVIRDILPIFAAAWPNVVLEVKTAPSYTLREQVQAGKLHGAVLTLPLGQREGAQVLVATTPVWVAAASRPQAAKGIIPLAIHAADCPYRSLMLESLKAAGYSWRVVLDSPSSQAIRACVESGLAITLMDRAKMSSLMRIVEELPQAAEHEVMFLRSAQAQHDEALELLAQAIHQHFRL